MKILFCLHSRFSLCSLVLLLLFLSCSNGSQKKGNKSDLQTFTNMEKELSTKDIKEEKTSFVFDGTTHFAYITWEGDSKGKRPGIIVIPEWWGLNDYARKRAEMLAALGYTAMAVDVFGNGAIGHTPQEAMKLIKPYTVDLALCKKIIDTTIQKFKTYPQLDENKIAVIGYCFGGFVAINAGKLGANVKGVVGFHPSLGGVKPVKDSVKAKFLICHGGDDQFENGNVSGFKKEMDDAGIEYTFKVYPHAKHAFTNPEADANAKKFDIPLGYNAEADSNSWNDMKVFLEKIFR